MDEHVALLIHLTALNVPIFTISWNGREFVRPAGWQKLTTRQQVVGRIRNTDEHTTRPVLRSVPRERPRKVAMTIKAIETRYAGCRFRSRLEARWAVFFDALDIKWKYEPQGYVVGPPGDEIAYLPDFYLPKYDVWAEVKGGEWDKEDRKKTFLFSHDADILLLGSFPTLNQGDTSLHNLLRWFDDEFDGAGIYTVAMEFTHSGLTAVPFHSGIHVRGYGHNPSVWSNFYVSQRFYVSRHEDYSFHNPYPPSAIEPYDKARSARFGYRERG